MTTVSILRNHFKEKQCKFFKRILLQDSGLFSPELKNLFCLDTYSLFVWISRDLSKCHMIWESFCGLLRKPELFWVASKVACCFDKLQPANESFLEDIVQFHDFRFWFATGLIQQKIVTVLRLPRAYACNGTFVVLPLEL